ncbi:hypothetical protein CEE69_00705 [Rhodopirellula bahusiensis]|uniref:Uncharacterized protein n=1 Tax=Rhodopirellula bahusiensis TaxID=2014065 RepID=A0A2G1WD51_9BACT|nr:hypothetical protein CEE69_00705 [Rhodopirellula bahusiensis]
MEGLETVAPCSKKSIFEPLGCNPMLNDRHLKLNSSEEYQASVTFLLTPDAGCRKLRVSTATASLGLSQRKKNRPMDYIGRSNSISNL